MRRVVLSVPVLVAAVGGFAAAPWAQAPGASATPVAARAEPGKAVCTVPDSRLTEISGMVATSDGYVVVNDSSDLESHRKIFFLDGKCKVDDVVSYPTLPRDPEDMARSADGTIWIADIGDNEDSAERRSTIALWKLPKGADQPTIYRMSYPDGPHNAEALLLAGDGTPVVVTKQLGKAGVYTPTAPLKKGQTVGLQKVGEFTPPKTTTSNPLAAAGRLTVTGGANAPDGSRVVLRTYADAFEFDVTDGNVVEAITKGTPRITPLPDEPRGEAITYSADGKSFLTVSETAAEPASTKPKILRYAPATAAQKDEPQKVAAAAGKTDNRSWFDDLTLSDITYIIGAVGVLGLVLVGIGVFGIMRARRRPQDEPAALGEDGSPSGTPAESAQAPISPVPGGDQGHDPSVWDRQPPAGTEYRSGSARGSGREYRSGSARGSGGEYRSSSAVQADVSGPSGADDRPNRPSGSGRGGVYGTPAQRTSGGTVYGGGRSGGGSQDDSSNQYEPPYDYADREPRH